MRTKREVLGSKILVTRHKNQESIWRQGVVQRSNSLERIKSMVLSTENGKRLSHYQDSDNDNPYS